jgi:hypothetical protein
VEEEGAGGMMMMVMMVVEIEIRGIRITVSPKGEVVRHQVCPDSNRTSTNFFAICPNLLQ